MQQRPDMFGSALVTKMMYKLLDAPATGLLEGRGVAQVHPGFPLLALFAKHDV
ncbi:MAG TPA: hypothetical protein VMS21_08660 [Methylomirabilota bacterium]|nr:hypothetical protein [Methylomirabilota bacterium]